MSTWVLILTLAASADGRSPVAIHSVPGFESRAACVAAAVAWANNVGAHDKFHSKALTVCVEQTKGKQ